jgi:hypothetical protein
MEPVIGRRLAPTRWRGMTVVSNAVPIKGMTKET